MVRVSWSLAIEVELLFRSHFFESSKFNLMFNFFFWRCVKPLKHNPEKSYQVWINNIGVVYCTTLMSCFSNTH